MTQFPPEMLIVTIIKTTKLPLKRLDIAKPNKWKWLESNSTSEHYSIWLAAVNIYLTIGWESKEHCQFRNDLIFYCLYKVFSSIHLVVG